MRFVHAADIHLDSPLVNLALPEQRQVDLVRGASRDAFQNLIQLCIERDAKLLVLAGDLWDGDFQNVQTTLFFRSQIARLDKAGIRVVIKKGNHDAANRISGTLDLPANARVFDDSRPEAILYEDLGAVLHGQSFTPGPVTENLAARYLSPVAGMLNIGVLHTSLAGGTYHDPYAPCSFTDLTTKGYAYWALGHIHKGSVLNRNPWIVYPGNLQGRDIRETGGKGCVVVDTDGDQVINVEPVAVDVVRWQETRIDIASIDRVSKLPTAILKSLDSSYRACDGRPCATRVIFEGTSPIAAEMQRRPDWLHQTVLESAAEISDELWIEQLVNNATALNVDPSRASSASDIDLEQLIAGVDAPTLRSALRDEFETIKSKLPDALKSHPSLALAESDDALLTALRRLAPKLASRLAGERLS